MLIPDTGNYRWHYQVMPEESWDYNAMDIVLADLEIKGETKKVLMQAPKNGFLYVADRKTGKLIGADKFSQIPIGGSKIDLETGRPVMGEAATFSKKSQAIYGQAQSGHIIGRPWLTARNKNLFTFPKCSTGRPT